MERKEGSSDRGKRERGRRSRERGRGAGGGKRGKGKRENLVVSAYLDTIRQKF